LAVTLSITGSAHKFGLRFSLIFYLPVYNQTVAHAKPAYFFLALKLLKQIIERDANSLLRESKQMDHGKEHNKEHDPGKEHQKEKDPGTGYNKGKDPGTEHLKNNRPKDTGKH
jgi:hypothetical protein